MSTNDLLKELYLRGESRQKAMEVAGITNNNTMSGKSNRLKLYWRWPLKNRISGIAPVGMTGNSDTLLARKIKSKSMQKAALVAPPPAPEIPAPAAAAKPETIPSSSPFKPSPGFLSSRERRNREYTTREDLGRPLREYADDGVSVADMEFLMREHEKQFA